MLLNVVLTRTIPGKDKQIEIEHFTRLDVKTGKLRWKNPTHHIKIRLALWEHIKLIFCDWKKGWTIGAFCLSRKSKTLTPFCIVHPGDYKLIRNTNTGATYRFGKGLEIPTGYEHIEKASIGTGKEPELLKPVFWSYPRFRYRPTPKGVILTKLELEHLLYDNVYCGSRSHF